MREYNEKRLEEQAQHMPPDAYLKAWDAIQRLDSGEEVPAEAPEPQSWLTSPSAWIAALADRLLASPANAVPNSCSNAAPWVSVGPAGYKVLRPTLYFGSEGAGIIKAIAVDPRTGSPPQTIYVGTRGGGLWQTTTGGTSQVAWQTTTDNLSSPNVTSLQLEAITVDTTSGSSVVFAGTGLGSTSGDGGLATSLPRSIGTLRSTNGGASWQQIGPTWCTSADSQCWNGTTCIKSDPVACPSSTSPNASSINVKEIAIDDTGRVWIATSKGLWYSDTARTASSPSGVTWYRVLMSSAATGPLNRLDGSPDWINHAFVSPTRSTKRTLYVSVVPMTSFLSDGNDNPAHWGWYKTDHTNLTSWTRINGSGGTALPPQPVLERAGVHYGASASADTIYSLVNGVSSSQCGVGATRTRIYKTSNSGSSWTLTAPSGTCEGVSCTDPICDCCLSVQVAPNDPARVVAGGQQLFSSSDGWQTASRISIDPTSGNTAIHIDQNALTFDPANKNNIFVGNDGGIWRGDLSTSPVGWTNLRGNLSNLEFYGGAADTLNSSGSAGGLQDNGTMKGGNASYWTVVTGGDGTGAVIDATDSNVWYRTAFASVARTSNGGYDFSDAINGLATPAFGLAADPLDPNTLVANSEAQDPTPGARKIHRTLDGAASWVPISQQIPSDTGALDALAPVPPPAPTPRSTTIYGGSQRGEVWKTTNLAVWNRVDVVPPLPTPPQLPAARPITSVVIDPSTQCQAGAQLCSAACACTMYVTIGGVSPLGHVFRSIDSGAHWTLIAAPLPDVPANRLVLDPQCANRVYVGTDMGIYQGTLNNGTCGTNNTGTWSWCTYGNGFPVTAMVKDLTTQVDGGLLRAFTYGRGVWAAKAFGVPYPDVKVNGAPAVTFALGVNVGTGTTGQQYVVTWSDDRLGANNRHIYLRGFKYVAQGQAPAALGSDFRVDDTLSTHIAQAPHVAGYLVDTDTANPYCARVTWQDDRLDQTTHVNNVFFQGACSNGGKTYGGDVRVDTAATGLNALKPVIANQPISAQVVPDFAVAWMQDRASGGALHDVYARFFNWFGIPKANPFLLSSTTLDASNPAIVAESAKYCVNTTTVCTSDAACGGGAGSCAVTGNVFVAWEEYDSSPTKLSRNIFLRKYNASGSPIGTAVQVNVLPSPIPTPPAPVPQAQEVALTVDATTGRVTATWYETKSDGTQPETIFYRRFTHLLAALDTTPPPVNSPPSAPIGVKRAAHPGIASDSGGNFAVTWNGNVNDPESVLTSGFGKTFSVGGVKLKSDFRVDSGGRAAVMAPRVARSAQPKSFSYGWRDARSGVLEVYTRLAQSIP